MKVSRVESKIRLYYSLMEVSSTSDPLTISCYFNTSLVKRNPPCCLKYKYRFNNTLIHISIIINIYLPKYSYRSFYT